MHAFLSNLANRQTDKQTRDAESGDDDSLGLTSEWGGELRLD